MTREPDLLSRIEQKRLWAYFHKDWLLQVRDLLRPQLPREMSLFVESEAVLIAPGDTGIADVFAPDLGVARREPILPVERRESHGSAAVLEVEQEVELYQSYSLRIRRAPENRLVAVMELLSPTNKGIFGEVDREKYLRKRDGYLEAGLSLLEVDALLMGERLLPPALASLSARIAMLGLSITGRVSDCFAAGLGPSAKFVRQWTGKSKQDCPSPWN